MCRHTHWVSHSAWAMQVIGGVPCGLNIHCTCTALLVWLRLDTADTAASGLHFWLCSPTSLQALQHPLWLQIRKPPGSLAGLALWGMTTAPAILGFPFWHKSSPPHQYFLFFFWFLGVFLFCFLFVLFLGFVGGKGGWFLFTPLFHLLPTFSSPSRGSFNTFLPSSGATYDISACWPAPLSCALCQA